MGFHRCINGHLCVPGLRSPFHANIWCWWDNQSGLRNNRTRSNTDNAVMGVIFSILLKDISARKRRSVIDQQPKVSAARPRYDRAPHPHTHSAPRWMTSTPQTHCCAPKPREGGGIIPLQAATAVGEYLDVNILAMTQ